ncbi:MAG: EFR1 family ferrodoxin [Candidatus Thorarchaeota archaeon]
MKHRIFYFTGTGNSLMVAREIGDALGDTTISSIAQFRNEDQDQSYDTIGIVFPVYWGGLPHKVLEFIPRLEGYTADYIFAIETHAGDPEDALSQLNSELQSIGLELHAGFLLRMPSNYILDYDAPSEGGVKRIIENADRTIHELVKNIRDRIVNFSSADYSGHSSSYVRFLNRVNTSDEKFWVNDNCTECEVCVRVCPVQNIRMNEDRPEWQHNCEQCLACINWCPEQAIQFGTGTESRGRYTNPRVLLEDMEH